MPLTKTQKAQRKARAKQWKAFREKHLLSQVDLATSLGLSRRTVQNVENEDGDYIPYASTLLRFDSLKTRFEGKSDAPEKPHAVRRRRGGANRDR